jgi:hypothetical protein
MSDIEHAIRERAYRLWLEGGCKLAQADMHWVAAQREVLISSLSKIARVTLSDRSARERQEKESAAD